MSYDINVWSINPVKLPETLPTKEKWRLEKELAIFSKKDYQIVVSESAILEEEDIPEEVMPVLPGIKYLTEISLEPISAPLSAKSLLQKVSRSIAKDTIGVIQNQQDDSLITPSGVKRFIPTPRMSKERISVLEMSWWFGDNPLAKEEILYKLVDYFEKVLPEALPRRYGEYEPPQYKYQENGKEHAKKFLSDHVYNSAVWYTTKPVIYVNYGFLQKCGFIMLGNEKRFRSNHLSIEIDSSVLKQPGWEEHLHKVFKDISFILNPFYGEVRILHDRIYRHGVSAFDYQTESNPTISWWWMGIPYNLGEMIVVGEPYLNYWPKVKEKGLIVNSLYFVSTDDWSKGKNVNKILGKVPKDIALIKEQKVFKKLGESLIDDKHEYPKVFPFNNEDVSD